MSINQIKKLREETGAGMLDCKKALEDSQNDYNQAFILLKSTTKKNDGNNRVASKGLCSVKTSKNEAILFEVNAETDFVAKNPHFTQMIDLIGSILLHSKANYPKEALGVKTGDLSIQNIINQTASVIKENA